MFHRTLFPKFIREIGTLLFVLFAASITLAQNGSGKISVTAAGEAIVVPDQLEILATLSVDEKTPAEAGEVFAEKREQLVNALNPMDFPDLKIKSLGKKIANTQAHEHVVMFDGGGATAKEISYTAQESMQIVVKQKGEDFTKGVELLTRVEEQIAKCGAKVGRPENPYVGVVDSQSLIVGSLSDRTKAVEIAWTDAIEKARTKARTLAKLSGLELGKIVSVKEVVDSEANAMTQFYSSVIGATGGGNGNIGKIKVTTSLVIEFAAK